MKNNVRIYAVLAGLIFIIFTWAQSFFINYLISLGLVAIIVTVINMFVIKKHLNKNFYHTLLGISILFIISKILWMIFDQVGLWVIAQISFVTIGFSLFIFGLRNQTKSKQNFTTLLSGIVKWISTIILIAITSILIILTVTSQPYASFIQKITGDFNNYEAKEPSKSTTIDGKYQLTNNIHYGGKYPRSNLDILTPYGQIDDKRPTYFYVHGGGWIVGDKMLGDPYATAGDNYTLYHFKKMIDHGYNVVAINYALAPEYQHPTPVKQLSEAVQFMQKNGDQYGINMDDVVFSGGSAGGHIVTDFVTIQANREYAKEIGIDPVIQLKNIKGLVLESPLLDPARIHKTVEEDVINDYLFGQSLSAYLGQPLVSGDKATIESTELISKATSDFPPTFISDGNSGSFRDQAEEYYNRLKELGVKTGIFIPDINESQEGHGFMVNIDSKATQTYIERKLDFLDKLE